jgi:hypothetical protein
VTECIKVEYGLHAVFDGLKTTPNRTSSATLEIVSGPRCNAIRRLNYEKTCNGGQLENVQDSR